MRLLMVFTSYILLPEQYEQLTLSIIELERHDLQVFKQISSYATDNLMIM